MNNVCTQNAGYFMQVSHLTQISFRSPAGPHLTKAYKITCYNHLFS